MMRRHGGPSKGTKDFIPYNSGKFSMEKQMMDRLVGFMTKAAPRWG